MSYNMETRKCTYCNTVKSASDFYARPLGMSPYTQCKECISIKYKAYYKNNPNIREKQLHKNNKLVPSYKERLAKYNKIRSIKYKEQVKAKDILNKAVSSGKIVRQPCEVCGNAKSQGHHDDYTKPLEVRWLCDYHHKEVHGRIVYSLSTSPKGNMESRQLKNECLGKLIRR